MIIPDRMSIDPSLVREESSSNIGISNSSSPTMRRKKEDFKDDAIGEIRVQLHAPTAVWKMLHS